MGACLCIIIDAHACGKLTDDRPPRSPIAKGFDDLTHVVKHLRNLHKNRNPRHWRITDSEWCSCSKKYDDPTHEFGPLCTLPPP